MATGTTPQIGTRIFLSGSVGTIKYSGPVDGTNGFWLGVEWDDPARGKHDGIKDGIRYFQCLVPGSGSFIRPTAPHINYGKSFLSALLDKYVDMPQGASGGEYMILGSSKGAIQVEAVNLDKIRGKFSDIETLREISLDREHVAYVDGEGLIREKCPNLRSVDLSFSLVSSWDVIALIANELPLLEQLTLNNNRLQPFSSPNLDIQSFRRLVELQLNATLTQWRTLLDVITRMPVLKHVEMGYNRLSSLVSDQAFELIGHPLQLINFDSNQLSQWDSICHALRPMKQLERVILSANYLSTIPSLEQVDPFVEPLSWKYISLASTRISSWASIDALAGWCPQLEGLNLHGTPLVDESDNSRVWRQIAIARLPSLCTLDGASISDRQRSDAELYYISIVARMDFISDEERNRAHPQWVNLCLKHGNPLEAPRGVPKEDTLRSRLMNISVRLVDGPIPPSDHSALPSPKVVRLLPTMPLRLARLKLLKSLKMPPQSTKAVLWERMIDGDFQRIGSSDGSDDGREVDWWLQDGADVVLCIE